MNLKSCTRALGSDEIEEAIREYVAKKYNEKIVGLVPLLPGERKTRPATADQNMLIPRWEHEGGKLHFFLDVKVEKDLDMMLSSRDRLLALEHPEPADIEALWKLPSPPCGLCGGPTTWAKDRPHKRRWSCAKCNETATKRTS